MRPGADDGAWYVWHTRSIMVLAEFNFLDAVTTGILIFFLITFFWLLMTVCMDLFSDDDVSGWAKAGWVLLLVVLPLLGTLIYFIARGSGMQKRAIAKQQAAKAEFDAYVREQAGTATPADQLQSLVALHEAGKLTDDEFASMKAKIVTG